jgi:ABC-type antimicrobial peptide transport system permease subunit
LNNGQNAENIANSLDVNNPRKSGSGVAAFVCSMVGFLFPPVFLVSIPLGIYGVIGNKTQKGFAIAALIISVLGICFFVVALALIMMASQQPWR